MISQLGECSQNYLFNLTVFRKNCDKSFIGASSLYLIFVELFLNLWFLFYSTDRDKCQNIDWGYNYTNSDRKSLAEWAFSWLPIQFHVVNPMSISRGRRNNYRPCWNAECKHFYQVLLRAPQDEVTSSAASFLLSHLNEKRKDRCSEAFNNIDFTQSSRLILNIINNLTGRIRHTRRLCPITAKLIALQLVKNRIFKTKKLRVGQTSC